MMELDNDHKAILDTTVPKVSNQHYLPTGVYNASLGNSSDVFVNYAGDEEDDLQDLNTRRGNNQDQNSDAMEFVKSFTIHE